MSFDDLVALLKNPGDEPIPDTIYDDLTASYRDLLDGSNASIGEKDNKIMALESEISRLKAANYDLLMASGSAPVEDEPNDDDDDDETTIDDLFEDERD